MRSLIAAFMTAGLLAGASTSGEILSASDTHFELRHESGSKLTADQLWQRLSDPASWWHPDHTYSEDAANLTLDLQAGGLWREDWDGRSVSHGRVLYVEPGRMLHMEAPFGPLQGLGAYTIWTITVTGADGGSLVVFEEVSTGPPTASMAETAKAVDFVKGEAIRRLRNPDQP